MTSPYSTRRTKQISDNDTLFESKDINQPSTNSSSELAYVFETDKKTKMPINRQAQFKTPQSSRRKAKAMARVMSQQDLSNAELLSSSLYESSHLHRKSKREVIKSQSFEHDVLKMSHEHSNALSCQQLQKDNDKKHMKIEGDLQNENERKSYKKINSFTCLGVPYRKCHSSMQQKVVSIMNKIKSGKDCHREIETLMDRTKKVSTKELNNKYFVSGIQLIFNLSMQNQYKQIFNQDLRKKINFGLEDLKNRILQQLDNTKAFQPTQTQYKESSDRKLELVKRIYRILRKKLRNLEREEVQKRAIQTADRFMVNKCNKLRGLYEELRFI